MFSGSQRDYPWCGLEALVVLKLVKEDRDEATFLRLVNRQEHLTPTWGRIKGDSQPQFEFVEALVFSVRLLVFVVDFLEFSPFVWSFFELLSLLRKDEDDAIQFSRVVNRRGRCVYDAGDGHGEDAARERGCVAF